MFQKRKDNGNQQMIGDMEIMPLAGEFPQVGPPKGTVPSPPNLEIHSTYYRTKLHLAQRRRPLLGFVIG
jgi:hypothetical protein